ncbi:hypothetical protein K8T06_01550, partial [bacterium]|nr:hypothetical protein [bacterium]
YCLGVKNALFKVVSESEYEKTLKPQLMHIDDDQSFEKIDSACARKLVEGAVSYAKELGFSPHKDYRSVKKIFGNIDSDACPTNYIYGKDGKPYYVRGPNESEIQAKRIINQLQEKCGEGNYDYLSMLD